MAPIIEAFLLIQEYQELPDGRPVLVGVYPPSLVFDEFPTEPHGLCAYTRLREVQSAADARRLQVVCTSGAEGKEWGRQALFHPDALTAFDVTPGMPLHSISANIYFPPARFKRPDTIVYKVEYDGRELARITLEVLRGPLSG